MSNINTILQLLPSLTADELAVLRERIAVMTSLTGPSVEKREGEKSSYHPVTGDNANTGVDLALECIIQTCRVHGLEVASSERLRNSNHYHAFSRKAVDVLGILKQSNLTRTQIQTIILIGLDVLRHNLAAMHIGVSAAMLMRHFHRLPGLLNREFPGYAMSGMLRFLARPVGQ